MHTPKRRGSRRLVELLTALVCVFSAGAFSPGAATVAAAEFDVDSGRVILRQLQFCVDCGSALLVSGVRPGVLVRCPDCGKEQTRLANPYVLSQVYQICKICQAPLNPEGHKPGDTVECGNCHTPQVLDRDAFASAKKTGDKNLGLGYMPGFPPGTGKKTLLLSPNKADGRLSMIPLPEGSGELPLPPELAFRKIPAPPETSPPGREAFEDLAALPSPLGEAGAKETPRSASGKSAEETSASPRGETPPQAAKSPAPSDLAAAPKTVPEPALNLFPAGPAQPLPSLPPMSSGQSSSSGAPVLGIGPIGRGDVAVAPDPMLPITETVIRKTPSAGANTPAASGQSNRNGKANPLPPTQAPQWVPERTQERVQERIPERVQEPSLARVQERPPERIQERPPERVKERPAERSQPKRLTEVMEVPAVTADLFGGPREGNGANDERYISSGKVVARVDGEPIYARDVARVVDPVMRRLRSQAGVSEQELAERENGLKREVLERLIDREVAMREAAAIGFRPDPAAVRDREVELAQILAGSGVDIRTEARRDITMQEMRRRFAEKPATASPGEIREFYKQHKGQMIQPRMIALDQIVVYEDRTYRRDKRSAKEIAFAIASELEAGSRFDDLRARYDEFWEAAGLGYNAPTLQVGGGMSRQILASLGEMRKGAVFGPVMMSGMALFGKIVDERPEGPAPFEEVKEDIRKKLEADAAERNLDNWLKRLRQKTRVEVLP